MSKVQVWSVSLAGRYENGYLIDHIDTRHMSDGKPFMVVVEDYEALAARIAELEAVLQQIVIDIDTIEEWTDRQILDNCRKIASECLLNQKDKP